MQLRSYLKDATTIVKMYERRKRRLVRLPPVPDPRPGARIGPPDYVGIGVQKAGTTWWSHLLSQHPQNESLPKELRYFQVGWNADFTDKEIDRYHRYFPRSSGTVAGEWTPNYITQPWAIERLKRAAPNATLLVLLRDPLARLRSGLRHYAFHIPGPLEMEYVYKNIDAGLYSRQLDYVQQHFSREQIFLLQFEKCLSNPEGEIARTYERLGLDPDFRPNGILDRVNEGRGTPVPLSGDFELAMRELYLPDAARLASEWPEIDLSLWPNVASKQPRSESRLR